MDEINIDGTDLVLGRLSAKAAKLARKGVRVNIVNSENIIITGKKKKLVSEYLKRVKRGSAERGPFYPKRPDRLVKRTIRGMLNYKKPSGRKALSRIRVFIGLPEDLKNKINKDFKCKNVNDLKMYKFIKIEELCEKIGGKW